jgi:hypothetical protein
MKELTYHNCRRCKYRRTPQNVKVAYCAYILHNEAERPCLAGDACTVGVTRSGKAIQPNRKVLRVEAAKLFETLSDEDKSKVDEFYHALRAGTVSTMDEWLGGLDNDQ